MRFWPGTRADHVIVPPRAKGGDAKIDWDGIDTAVFPALAMPTPGGLTCEDRMDLLQRLSR